jgi:hypothetical protein
MTIVTVAAITPPRPTPDSSQTYQLRFVAAPTPVTNPTIRAPCGPPPSAHCCRTKRCRSGSERWCHHRRRRSGQPHTRTDLPPPPQLHARLRGLQRLRRRTSIAATASTAAATAVRTAKTCSIRLPCSARNHYGGQHCRSAGRRRLSLHVVPVAMCPVPSRRGPAATPRNHSISIHPPLPPPPWLASCYDRSDRGGSS